MPNWCANWVSVYSDEEGRLGEVKRSLEGPDGSAFDFRQVVPLPAEDGELDGGGGMDGYDRRIEEWGTKWNTHEVNLQELGGVLVYTFNTAWAPPVPVIEALARRFVGVEVTLAYDEPGMDFGGFMYWVDGELVDQLEGASRMTPWFEVADERRAFG